MLLSTLGFTALFSLLWIFMSSDFDLNSWIEIAVIILVVVVIIKYVPTRYW